VGHPAECLRCSSSERINTTEIACDGLQPKFSHGSENTAQGYFSIQFYEYVILLETYSGPLYPDG
jgi:hypothetical protein